MSAALFKDMTATDAHTKAALGGDKRRKRGATLFDGAMKPKPASDVAKAGWTLSVPITKVDDEQRIVWGWASVIEDGGAVVKDHQGDMIDAAELAKAAHGFMRDYRVGGDMHRDLDAGTVVESLVFTPEVQKALGIDLGKVGWFIGVHVPGDDVWKRVKGGELKAFSIGGKAMREVAA